MKTKGYICFGWYQRVCEDYPVHAKCLYIQAKDNKSARRKALKALYSQAQRRDFYRFGVEAVEELTAEKYAAIKVTCEDLCKLRDKTPRALRATLTSRALRETLNSMLLDYTVKSPFGQFEKF